MHGPTRTTRPWGEFELLVATPGLVVKRLRVLPGQRLSYQRHAHRSEHWYVLAGTGTAVLDGIEKGLVAGDSLDVPVGAAHRLCNPGRGGLVVVEVQTGTHLVEDDIERLEDDYGRVLHHRVRP